jgi:hypothetical protein
MNQTRSIDRRPASLATLLLLVLASSGLPTAADAATKPVNASRLSGVAIHGYDTVAYHLEGKPLKGSDAFEHQWNGATWRFASAAHRDTFAADPGKWAPAYGGWCAYGVSKGGTYDIDPAAWSIVDGRLYLNYDLDVRTTWLEDPGGYISKANANWTSMVEE